LCRDGEEEFVDAEDAECKEEEEEFVDAEDTEVGEEKTEVCLLSG
jgi:hypothetical protein